MTNLLLGCLFLLFMLLTGLYLKRKLRTPYFESTPEGVGRISLGNCELIDCNLPLAEILGFSNCHDCKQHGVEVDLGQNSGSNGSTLCKIIIEDDFVKTVEVLVVAKVEHQYVDFMIIGEPEHFDLFNHLSVPLLRFNQKMEILDLNSPAILVFGKHKKGLSISNLIATPLRDRVTNIMKRRSLLHKTFSLTVPIVSSSGDHLIQRWGISAKNHEESYLTCLSVPINKGDKHGEEKYLLYEQIYPGQSVFWETGFQHSFIRYSDIGHAWQRNFNLPGRASIGAWLDMVHPLDRQRVSKEFKKFFLNSESVLNCSYRMASIQGVELTITSIGIRTRDTGIENTKNANEYSGIRGMHQIIESYDPNGSQDLIFRDSPYSRFLATCRSLGLHTNWISHDSKMAFPPNVDFSQILSLIISNRRDIKDIEVGISTPNEHNAQCVSCGEAVSGRQLTITLVIPDLYLPPRHLEQILKYGYKSDELVEPKVKYPEELQALIHNIGGHLTVRILDGNLIYLIFLRVRENATVKKMEVERAKVSRDSQQGQNSNLLSELNRRTLSILLIDDQEVVLRYLSETLRLEGYQVTSMACAKEALALFESDPMKYDLVMTDQNMEGLSGTELTKLMLARRPELPIIMSSGHDQSFGDSDASNLGALAFFNKPFDMPKLMELLRKLAIRAENLA